MTSICSISRQYGVRIMRKLTSEIVACTLTTFRTSGASTNFTSTSLSVAKNGNKIRRSTNTAAKVVAIKASYVTRAMVGKRIYSTQRFTGRSNARQRSAKRSTAPTSTMKMRNDRYFPSGS